MTTSKIKQLILPNLPYILLFWFFSKLGETYRLSEESEIVFRVLDVVSNLNEVIQNPVPTFYPFDLVVGLAGAGLIFCFVLYKKANAKKWRKDMEYGSARWGNKKDIAHYVDPVPEKNVILTATESLMLNSRPKNPKYARNKNVLVIGGSGSGKTRFFLKPNLMQAHSSYCITDPKGTLVLECGKFLKRAGYELKILNTIDFSKSMRYNPLAYIRSEKDILKLVTALIANTTPSDQKGGDPFWTKAETLLYCALIGYIHYEAAEEEKNLNSLVEMINAMEVREDDETYKNAVDYLFENLENGIPQLDDDGNPMFDENEEPLWESPPKPQHFAVRQYKKYLLAAGKTAKSILISCGARLATFDIKEVRDMMSYDEMGLDTIGDRKTALFIIISDTDDSFAFIAALMYSQLFNLLCDKADNEYGGRLPVHVRFLLDEFANIGQIPKFDKLIATIRSR
jgi:type IV secretion system protein VirD4